MQSKNNTIYKTILTLSGLIIIFAGLKTADKIIVPFFLIEMNEILQRGVAKSIYFYPSKKVL